MENNTSGANYNQNLIRFEKNKRNILNKKFSKLFKFLQNNKLSFVSLEDEIKFLNQIYFLHQKMEDLNEMIDETMQIMKEVKEQKKITKSFRHQIKEDNYQQQQINNLATLVFLSQS